MSGGGKKAISEINVTPLVDVMLVLLVVFVVTTPIIVEETKRSVDIDLPKTSARCRVRTQNVSSARQSAGHSPRFGKGRPSWFAVT